MSSVVPITKIFSEELANSNRSFQFCVVFHKVALTCRQVLGPLQGFIFLYITFVVPGIFVPATKMLWL